MRRQTGSRERPETARPGLSCPRRATSFNPDVTFIGTLTILDPDVTCVSRNPHVPRRSLIRSARLALNALQVTASAALLLRLFGVWAAELPSSGRLAVSVLLLHVADLALRRRRICRVGAFIARRRFPFALAAIMLLALAVRLPGFASDIGQTPVDIDENRLALNVRHFFVTGELAHGTVEHYPGVVFWMFAAASFVAYVRGLAAGVALSPDLLPGATFVFACRFMNIFVAAGIVGLTGLLGRRLSGAATGLLAAATVAIVPLSVDTTVLVRNDPGWSCSSRPLCMRHWWPSTPDEHGGSLPRGCWQELRPRSSTRACSLWSQRCSPLSRTVTPAIVSSRERS